MKTSPKNPVTNKQIESNFTDIHPPFKPEEAAVESDRCLYCYDAPCIQACPTHIEVPRFIKQIASGNPNGAARVILEANPMGHSCARVCPVEVLCEGACVYTQWQQKPIEIARLQRYATDHIYAAGQQLFSPSPEPPDRNPVSPIPSPISRKIAIIGAGPGGLSCAFYLRRMGYHVTIFEKKPKAGGLNTYGIAEYKMTQATALSEADMVESMGAEFRYGVAVGEKIPWSKIESDFDAVFLGVGLGPTQQLGIPGEKLRGVMDALSFIERIKTRRFGSIEKSGVTVVIGAGNTAIDAVTQAKRLGTAKVIMAYRRGREEMSAYDYEYEIAKKDAVEFLWNATPVKIIGKSKVEAIEFVRIKNQGRGRKAGLSIVPKSIFRINCDRVIKAVGQEKQRGLLEQIEGLKLDASGRVVADAKTRQTSNPRFFAGGDAVNGGKEVVNAAQDGKRAAWNIHLFLGGSPDPGPEHRYWVSTIEKREIAPFINRHRALVAPGDK